jgi:hypothetical protein
LRKPAPLALKDEAVVDASWIAKERQSGQGRRLRFLFRADDALGSANGFGIRHTSAT